MTLQFLITLFLLGSGVVVFSILLFITDLTRLMTGSTAELFIFTVLLLTVSVTLSTWISGKYFDKRDFCDFGFQFDKEWWKDFRFGLFLGGGLMLLIFLFEFLIGWVNIKRSFSVINTDLPFGIAIFIPLIYFIAVGYYEELFSRGYQLTNLAEGLMNKRISPTSAILFATTISSFFFTLLHLKNPHTSILSTFNLWIAGFFLASGYIISGKLAVPIGLHISWNFFQGTVFGFPVSGTESFSAALITIQQSGPEIWTGGNFGPEGGLIGTTAQLLGIGLVLLYYWGYKKQEGLFTKLVEAPCSLEKEQ